MAYTYSHLYGLRCTGLRYFTVYGPWGRPDMSPILFADAITQEKPINLFNNGDMIRDFTYVDDIVDGTVKCIDHAPEGNPPYTIYNIGCSHPVHLPEFIQLLEESLGRKALINPMPMQPGDVPATWADTSKLERELGYAPQTTIQERVKRFADWYLNVYQPLQQQTK